MTLSFEVLGPLSVTAQGRQVAVGGPRNRSILALLLLSPGRIVSVDALIDAVWQDRPPATARTQVAICVAALRKTFKAEGCDDEVITTEHPGYRLRIGSHRLDLLEYQELRDKAAADARDGRWETAAEALREALALWHGPVLTGISGRQVEDEARQLEEQRLASYDEYAVLQLKLGRHHELAPALAALVREHPLRERSLQSLILAQYRSGRRADALSVYRDARRRLTDELGLEPGPELQELHDAVLRDDPALLLGQAHPPAPSDAAAVPAPDLRVVPSDLPPNVPGFTGRQAELTALDALLVQDPDYPRTDDQPPAVGFVTGVGGVGKTGLAVHWAHRNAQHFPDGRLFVDMCGHDPDHDPAVVEDVLSRFLRSLGVPAERIPGEFAERVSLYRSLMAGRRVLVVLDNARTYERIRSLLPGGGGCAVLVTSREPMEQLVLRHGAVRVQLGVLSADEAQQLLARVITGDRPVAERELLCQLAELCGRLPLALRIAAARLVSKPHWTVRLLVARLADERRRLDELSLGESQVRAGFAVSYRDLPHDAATLYRRLSVIQAPDFAVWVGAALLDSCAHEAERLMELLVDAQLLEVAGVDATGRLRYRFQNLLRVYAREVARDEEPPEQQIAARNRALASWLAIAEVAHRREYGGDFSVLHGSSPRPLLDQDLLEELVAEPLCWFEAERLALAAAVEQAAEAGLDELAWDLAASMMVLCETRNYPELWQHCCEQALSACRTTGNERGEAAMLSELGSLRVHQVRMDEAVGYLLLALQKFERVGDRHGWGLALARLAAADRHRGDLDRAGERLRSARQALHQVGDLSAEAHALNKLAQIEMEQGRGEEGLRLGEEAVRVARQVGRNRGAAQALHRIGQAYLRVGRYAEAEQALIEAVGIVREKRDQLGMCYALIALAECRLALERPCQAEADLRQAQDAAERLDSPVVNGQIQFVLARVWLAWGEPERSCACLLAARDAFELAGSSVWVERADEALIRLRSGAGNGGGLQFSGGADMHS